MKIPVMLSVVTLLITTQVLARGSRDKSCAKVNTCNAVMYVGNEEVNFTGDTQTIDSVCHSAFSQNFSIKFPDGARAVVYVRSAHPANTAYSNGKSNPDQSLVLQGSILNRYEQHVALTQVPLKQKSLFLQGTDNGVTYAVSCSTENK